MKVIENNVATLKGKENKMREDILDSMRTALSEVQSENCIMVIMKEDGLYSFSTMGATGTHAMHSLLCSIYLEDVVNEL